MLIMIENLSKLKYFGKKIVTPITRKTDGAKKKHKRLFDFIKSFRLHIILNFFCQIQALVFKKSKFEVFLFC